MSAILTIRKITCPICKHTRGTPNVWQVSDHDGLQYHRPTWDQALHAATTWITEGAPQ